MPRPYGLSALALLLTALACSGSEPAPATDAPADSPALLLSFDDVAVEAACGTCQFGMTGDDCALAVRLPGVSTTLWVDGTDIDDHGDAHADDGFCNAVRRAVVTGELDDGRFQVNAFELLPVEDQG